jgi:uncharacterized protein YecT (DUF1311 family)
MAAFFTAGGLAAFSSCAIAQDAAAMLRAVQKADQQLNEDYKTLMGSLSKKAGEQVRIAERAWLVYLTANEQAVREIVGDQDNVQAIVFSARLLEIEHRREELRALFGQPPSVAGSSPDAADAELNQVYQQSLRMLSLKAERRLREAQRAWIDFRDKQTKANSASTANVSPPSLVTLHRIASLKITYLGPSPSTTQSNTIPERDPALDPSIPDPFATAR